MKKSVLCFAALLCLTIESVGAQVVFEEPGRFLKSRNDRHASEMEIRPVPDGIEVAGAEDGNAADAVLPQVKDPITGFVTIGYLVGHHLARIIPNNLTPMGYKKIIERNILTCLWESV